MNKLTFPYPFWSYTNSSLLSLAWEEKDDNILIEASIPGVDKSEIELSYSSDWGGSKVKLKIPSKNVDEELSLSKQIDADKTKAKLDLGVLKITAPVVNTDRIIPIE